MSGERLDADCPDINPTMSSDFHPPSGELGISIGGQEALSVDRLLAQRRAARIALDAPRLDTIRDIEETTFRPVPPGHELDDESVERLRRLCQLWDVTIRPANVSSHRRFIGPVIVGVKRVFFRVLHFLLKDALHQQRSFNAEVIRALAEMSVTSRKPEKR